MTLSNSVEWQWGSRKILNVKRLNSVLLPVLGTRWIKNQEPEACVLEEERLWKREGDSQIVDVQMCKMRLSSQTTDATAWHGAHRYRWY